MTLNDRDLLEHLLALEEELLCEPSRSSPDRLKELLSPNFVEFGGSGRVFDRPSMIASLVDWESTTVHSVFDFTLLRLADDAALVTYRIESCSPDGEAVRESLRSSLWINEEDSWVVRFHQGTRKP